MNNTLEISGWMPKIYVDPDTGVNYLVIDCNGVLTPRYKADGTLFVSEVVK